MIDREMVEYFPKELFDAQYGEDRDYIRIKEEIAAECHTVELYDLSKVPIGVKVITSDERVGTTVKKSLHNRRLIC